MDQKPVVATLPRVNRSEAAAAIANMAGRGGGVRGNSDRTVVSIMTEFLIAALWPLCLAYYAWMQFSPAAAWGAACLTWAIGTTFFIVCTPRLEPPRVTSGAVLADVFMRRTEMSLRRPWGIHHASGYEAAARLAAQWFGGFIGFACLPQIASRDAVEVVMYNIWGRLGSYNVWSVFLLQISIASVMTAIWLRSAASHEPRTDVQKAIHSGAWVGSMMFPWGGPAFSIGSYLWVQNSFTLPSITIIPAMLATTVVSAVMGMIICEASYVSEERPAFAPVIAVPAAGVPAGHKF